MQRAPGVIAPIYGSEPLVSMDAVYGRQLEPGRTLDFDYEAYQAAADRIAKRPVDLTGLQIHLTPHYSSAGVYTHNNETGLKHITVRAQPDDPTETQNTLLHETRHFIDHQNGKLERSRLGQLTYDIAQQFSRGDIIKAAIATTLGFLAIYEGPGLALESGRYNSVTEFIAAFPYTHPGLYTEACIGSAAMLLAVPAVVARYCLDPPELAARRAGKMQTAHIVNVSRLDQAVTGVV